MKKAYRSSAASGPVPAGSVSHDVRRLFRQILKQLSVHDRNELIKAAKLAREKRAKRRA